jgi:antirestriction protein ArdC
MGCRSSFKRRSNKPIYPEAVMQIAVKNEKVQALLNLVKAGVASVLNSEDWKRYLNASAKFWRYSFRNQMLIALQKPDATRIAGYHTWLKLGRHVKKGERGIYILAPLLVKIQETEEQESRISLKGFRHVSVFDLSQTEGKELPSVYHPLSGEAPEGIFEKAKEFIQSKGYSVEFQAMEDGKYGYVNTENQIVLKKGVSPAQSLTVLIHEMSHALFGHLKEKGSSRERQELEAETTSWIVCKNLGLETDQTSFAYLALWSQNEERNKLLEEAAQRASVLAKEILESLDVRQRVNLDEEP